MVSLKKLLCVFVFNSFLQHVFAAQSKQKKISEFPDYGFDQLKIYKAPPSGTQYTLGQFAGFMKFSNMLNEFDAVAVLKFSRFHQSVTNVLEDFTRRNKSCVFNVDQEDFISLFFNGKEYGASSVHIKGDLLFRSFHCSYLEIQFKEMIGEICRKSDDFKDFQKMFNIFLTDNVKVLSKNKPKSSSDEHEAILKLTDSDYIAMISEYANDRLVGLKEELEERLKCLEDARISFLKGDYKGALDKIEELEILLTSQSKSAKGSPGRSQDQHPIPSSRDDDLKGRLDEPRVGRLSLRDTGFGRRLDEPPVDRLNLRDTGFRRRLDEPSVDRSSLRDTGFRRRFDEPPVDRSSLRDTGFARRPDEPFGTQTGLYEQPRRESHQRDYRDDSRTQSHDTRSRQELYPRRSDSPGLPRRDGRDDRYRDSQYYERRGEQEPRAGATGSSTGYKF